MNFAYSRSCRGKVRHQSQGAAEAAIRGLVKAGLVREDERMGAYFCSWCNGHHVGHRPFSEFDRNKLRANAE